MTRKFYPSDVSDDEWAFVALYLTLTKKDAPQHEHSLRQVFNGSRYIVRTGNAVALPARPAANAIYRALAMPGAQIQVELSTWHLSFATV